jgi:hypothetical protein
MDKGGGGGARSPVLGGEATVATRVRSSSPQSLITKMRWEITILPLAGKENYGGTTALACPLHAPPDHHIA